MKKMCVVDGCDRSCKGEMCARCRQRLRYWDGRPYTDILERKQQLTRLQSCITFIAKPKPAARRRVQARYTEARV